jgi:hypothetical protein
MEFHALDAHGADARAAWLVTFGDRVLGKVSEFGPSDFRITDAGPYCTAPRGLHRTRIGAACALMTLRRTNPGERTDDSGLTQIERFVLDFEGGHTTAPSDDERQAEAARLGLSPTAYRQILRHLRLDPRAYRRSPQAVERLRAWHEATLVRTARYRRTAPAALAEAS